jgi:hypothetical protein
MKKVLSFLLTLVTAVSFGQAVDTTSLEQKARYYPSQLYNKPIYQFPNNGITKAMNATNNLAAAAYNWGNHATAGYATMSALTAGLAGKENVITIGTTGQYWRGDKTWQTLNPAAVGLGNVNNTSDADKPISSATQTALNLKANDNAVVHLAGAETITGSKSFTAQITLGNNLIPDGDATRNIGMSGFRFNAYLSSILKGNDAAGINFSGTAGAFARFQPATHNLTLGAAGSTGTDTGERLQVIGTSKLAGDVTVTGNVLPEAANTRDIGGAAAKWANIYTTNILNPTSAINVGVTSGGVGINFRQGNAAQITGGAFPTTGNWFFQAPGAVPTDLGHRLQIQGTTFLNGSTSVGGNVLPDGDLTRSLGQLGTRWQLYTGNIYSGATANGIGFSHTSSANLFAVFRATTGNLLLQSPGTAPADAGERLQVMGTSRLAGNVTQPAGFSRLSYNTSDETTNFERGRIDWNANIFRIGTENGGTGQARDVQMVTPGGSFTVSAGGLSSASRNVAGVGSVFITQGTFTGASGNGNGISLLNTVNQSGTAGYKGLNISLFEQAIGSGSKLLIDAGTNSAALGAGTHTSKFTVGNDGLITVYNTIMPATTATYNLGSGSSIFGVTYTGTSISNGNYTVGSLATTGAITVRQGSASQNVAGFQPTTGNMFVQAPGTVPADVVTSQLTVNSTTKGVLLPRMTTAQKNAIVSPAEGLEVYDLDLHAKCFFNGTVWKTVATL